MNADSRGFKNGKPLRRREALSSLINCCGRNKGRKSAILKGVYGQNMAGKRPATFFFKINQSTLESRYKMLWDCQLENDVLPDPGPGTVLLFKESPDPLFKFWVERSYLTLDFRRTV